MSDRAGRLLELIEADELDALLITALANVRYMTGYTGSNGLAIIGPRTRVFVTDFRYVEQAAVEVDPAYDRRRDQLDLFDAVGDVLPAGGELRLGFDDANITVRQHGRLRDLLDGRIELVAAGGLVEKLRRVKDADEIARIRAAAATADAALSELLEGGLVGRTERQLADVLERAMRERGADRPSFEPVIAAGAHGALPHAQPRDVEVEPNQMVVIDWGAQLGGYCSDCTRTVATGEPSDEAREVYELVLAAERAGVGAVRAGAGGRDVDSVARAMIDEAGYGDQFGHGLGHGVGAEVHEAPRLSTRSEDELLRGDVVTVEPGVYLPGKFGVRIEDLVVVGDDGADVLTSLGKELLVVD